MTTKRIITAAAVTVWLVGFAINLTPATPDAEQWHQWCQQVDRSKLPHWNLKWLNRKPQRSHTVWITNYGPWEGFKGDSYHIACNKLPAGTVVWLAGDRQLKVVTNRGSSRNDSVARRKGGEFWVDRWTKQPRYDNGCQRLFVIGRAPWPK